MKNQTIVGWLIVSILAGVTIGGLFIGAVMFFEYVVEKIR